MSLPELTSAFSDIWKCRRDFEGMELLMFWLLVLCFSLVYLYMSKLPLGLCFCLVYLYMSKLPFAISLCFGTYCFRGWQQEALRSFAGLVSLLIYAAFILYLLPLSSLLWKAIQISLCSSAIDPLANSNQILKRNDRKCRNNFKTFLTL